MKTRIFNSHLLVGLLIGAACVSIPQAALAKAPAKPATASAGGAGGPAQASARELYRSGETKYKAGDYAGALADFQAVDNSKPTPQSARYIGLCHDKLGHYADAETAYERFLVHVPTKMQKEGDEIKKRTEEIKAMPGKLHLETTPPGATVTIDGKPQSQPSPLDVDLPPGKHLLHVSSDGHEAQDRDLDIAYATRTDVSLQLVENAAPPPPAAVGAVAPAPAVEVTPAPPPPPQEAHSKAPALITGGLAIVAAGVGTVFGIMALNDKSAFDATPTSSKADDGENHALIADMAFGVAITLGVTSAVLFLTNDEPAKAGLNAQPPTRAARMAAKKSAPFTFTPMPIVTPHGGGAGGVFRF